MAILKHQRTKTVAVDSRCYILASLWGQCPMLQEPRPSMQKVLCPILSDCPFLASPERDSGCRIASRRILCGDGGMPAEDPQ